MHSDEVTSESMQSVRKASRSRQIFEVSVDGEADIIRCSESHDSVDIVERFFDLCSETGMD